jgi:hypothetical protein
MNTVGDDEFRCLEGPPEGDSLGLPGARYGQRCSVPPGSKSGACQHEGPPGTWEVLSSPLTPVTLFDGNPA